MKRVDLNRLLQGARMPDWPDDYWDRFPERVVRRLQTERHFVAEKQPWRLAALAAAAACGLILGFILWHRTPSSGDASLTLRDGPVLRGILQQYPGRLHAIIQDGSGLHTLLSKEADVSPSDPILLEIKNGDARSVIVTFSGQRIRCGSTDVMVLSDLEGHVILIGDGFFWSRQISTGSAERVTIRAEQIPNNRMNAKPSLPL